MDFSTQNVEKAVHQFYVDASTQQEVNKWLMAAQISPQAWLFSGELLSKDKSPEVQFFGANTLHMKIARFWHEVPPDQIAGLRDKLMDHICNFANGPKMVLTRLCVALSAFAMHTMPEVWPDTVQSIINTFQTSDKLQSSEILTISLEMLTVLPEEFFTAYLQNYRRGLVRNELQKAIPQVLTMLGDLLKPESPSLVYEQCLRCFASWAQFGIPLQDAKVLIGQVFQALRSEAFLESAVEALVHLFAHPDAYRWPNTVREILPLVVQQQELLQTAKQNGDMDTCQSLVKLIVTACAQNTKLILDGTCSGNEDHQRLSLALVNMVLQCTAIPGHYPVDECCSDLPFCFWYNFQDDIIATEGDHNAVLIQVYQPVYMSLIQILLQKVQYPSDEEYEQWHSDEKESHRCYRQDIADTLMYAYNFLHEMLLCSLTQLFNQIVQKKSANDPIKWQDVEAVLFAMTSVAESVDIDEFLYLPSLFQHLNQIPCDNYKVISQALFLIGAYAEWLSGHPELLGNIIPLLLQGLKDQELAQSATLALKDVVQENQAHLVPHVSDILTASKASLDNNTVRGKDAIRLMSCLGYVLSVLPVNEIMNYLDILLAPHITELQHVASQKPTTATKAIVVHKLNMLCWLFGSLNIHWDIESPKKKITGDPQPVLLVLQKLLPLLPEILAKWISDKTIIEATCDMIKKGVRTLMEDFAPLVHDSVRLITQMYTAHPNPALLDLAKQIVILFAGDENFYETTQAFFNALCVKSLEVLQLPHIQEHTDLVESMMSFLGHIAKKSNKVYTHPNCNVLGLFQAGILGLALPETPTAKASVVFLCEFINCGERIPAVKQVITDHGHLLIERLIRAISGESPRAAVDPMSDIFYALNKHHFNSLCKWLNDLLAQEGFPNALITKKHKQQFTARIIKERVNKRHLKECVQEFMLQCRGLLGTEYGMQTLLNDPDFVPLNVTGGASYVAT